MVSPQSSCRTSTIPRTPSLQEYKQRIDILERENFNLKVRIYFMQEQQQKELKFTDDDQIYQKANNEVKVCMCRIITDFNHCFKLKINISG